MIKYREVHLHVEFSDFFYEGCDVKVFFSDEYGQEVALAGVPDLPNTFIIKDGDAIRIGPLLAREKTKREGILARLKRVFLGGNNN